LCRLSHEKKKETKETQTVLSADLRSGRQGSNAVAGAKSKHRRLKRSGIRTEKMLVHAPAKSP